MIKRALLCLLFCGSLSAANTDLLLVAPGDAELRPLLARMTSPRAETRAAWTFWLGELAGRRVVLTRAEGDPLNAVAATTLALRRYAPGLVVVFGAGRPHDPALRPGDAVVSSKFAAFDGIISPYRESGLGSDALRWHKLPHPMMTAGEAETPMDTFPADAKAMAIASALAPVRPGSRVLTGVLGSAHQVNREADRVALLRAQWGTSTEDRQSAHIAGCSYLLGVPVVGLVVVDGAPAECAALALQFLEALP